MTFSPVQFKLHETPLRKLPNISITLTKALLP